MIKFCIFMLLCLLLNFSVSDESLERIGNPDDKARIERPCPTYDLNCVRTFFQSHSQCKKTFGPVPEPISRPQFIFYLPRSNLSVIIVDVRIRGLNGKIEEFYINRETDNLVIAVEFSSITQTSDKIYFKANRRGREPVVTVSSYVLFLNPMIITAVIPKIDDLQLQDAECTTYSTSRTASFAFTPSALESTDLQPDLSIVSALTNLGEGIQELYLTDSAYSIATYIQYNLCDFGQLLT